MASGAHRKAGLLFAALCCAGAIAAGAWYAWSSARQLIYQITTHDAVHGLIAGAPVELHGVEIGKVAAIELADASTVRIRLSVADDAPLSRATVATITARGLAARGFAGYVYVALENTGDASGPLTAAAGQRYPEISAGPAKIDTIDTTAAAAIAKLDAVIRLLQPLLDPNTIASLQHTLEGAQRLTDRLGAVLDDKTLASLRQTLDAMHAITTTLADNSARIEALIANTDRDSREVQPLLTASNTTIRELNTQVLPQFYRVLADLETLTRTFGGVATQLARNPAVLLRGTETPPGPGER